MSRYEEVHDYLMPTGTDGEGYPVYEQSELDERYNRLLTKFEEREQGGGSSFWAQLDDILGNLHSVHYLPLARETIEVLTELVERSDDRRRWLAGELWACGFCWEIHRAEESGEHAQRCHKQRSDDEQLVVCTACDEQVPSQSIYEHRRERHSD